MKTRVWVLGLMALPLACKADVVDIIARAKPSIAIVGTFRATDSPRFKLRGTGFVVADGTLVVTNAHVLPPTAEMTPDTSLMLQLRQPDSSLQARQATVLEVDSAHDLALLKMSGAPAPALAMADSNMVKEGQSVVFLGFPIGGALGYSIVSHRGMVSSITAVAPPMATAQQLTAKSILSLRSGSFDIFQLDATAYPGNSGGPVLDATTGEVLAVINSVLVKGTKESALTSPTGISYAVPAKYAVQLLSLQKLP